MIVVSPEFLLSTWVSCDIIVGELDSESLKSDIVSCGIPVSLGSSPLEMVTVNVAQKLGGGSVYISLSIGSAIGSGHN